MYASRCNICIWWQCLRLAGTSGSVFVWLSTSVFGDYAKLAEHAAAADALQSAVTSLVYELLPCDLPLMEQHFDMTQEVIDIASRAIRRFPELPQRRT